MPTLAALRTEARTAYARGKGNPALKGYSKMSKAVLLAKLGRHEEAKAHIRNSRGLASTKTAGAIATSLSGDSATRRAQLKGRILRAVKREIDVARKRNPEISRDELRKVAGKAYVAEAKRIKAGVAEQKPKRGGFKGAKSDTPPQRLNPAADDLGPPSVDWGAIASRPVPASFTTVAPKKDALPWKSKMPSVEERLKASGARAAAAEVKAKRIRVDPLCGAGKSWKGKRS